MKTEKNIFLAFLLNFFFSLFEFVGGLGTGSIALMSDALHDMGDAISIGISYVLERKSRQGENAKYTYGYARYSVVGGFITTIILLLGSVIVIYNAIYRIFQPARIDYDGLLVFAIIGVAVNLMAAYFTHGGHSLNQKAVNLHMIEDVLGWVVVLAGAVLMRFTDWTIIDPLMSIGVAVFILIHSAKHLQEILDVFLEKTPHNISVEEIQSHLMELPGIFDVHHIHVWSMDGHDAYATMHIVTDEDFHTIKEQVRAELLEHGIVHVTLELETKSECCHNTECHIQTECHHHHHHH